MKGGNMYYFAFGSNMSEQQMKERCGENNYNFITIGLLKNYKFVYDGHSVKRNGAVANVVKDNNNYVWGVIYKINQKALNILDKHEGYKNKVYDRDVLIIRGNDNKIFKAYTYYRTGKEVGTPSEEYKETVKLGAEEHEIPEDYIKKYIIA